MSVEMTVTTQRRREAQFAPSMQRQQPESAKSQSEASVFAPGLKASLVGGFGLLILMLIGLIPAPEGLPLTLAILVVPGLLVVCLATGLLAGIFAGSLVKNSQQGGKVGWMAGFWAGGFGGIAAMLMAALGFLMAEFGQGVVNQFTPEQLTMITAYGLNPNIIALAGRVFGALVVYGIIGSLVSGLFSSIGGMIYPKLSSH